MILRKMFVKRVSVLLLLALSFQLMVAQPSVGTRGGKNQVPKDGALFETNKDLDASFKFAQITDLHISLLTQNNCEDLERVIADINKQKGLAFVLVSGDVTEGGDLPSLELAKKMLKKLEIPYYIISGNHETKWSASGATDFQRVFGDDHFRLQVNNVIFLGFNSGPVIRMGDGHVVPQDLYWLKRQLKIAGKKKSVFIVTHYPMKGGDVDNWYEVTDIARKFNVQGFIGGHYHRNMLLSYDGIPGIVGRSTIRDKEQLPGYTLYSVADSMYISEKRVGEEPRLWATLDMSPKMYVEGDSKLRPNYDVNNQYRQVKHSWESSLGSAIWGSAVADDEKCYVCTDNGDVEALSLVKGKKVWKFSTLSRIIATPALSEGKLVVTSTDGFIYCLNSANGEQLWKVKTARPVLGVPTIADGVVYVGASDGKFRALQLSDGSEKWSFSGIGNYVESKPVVTDSLVVFGAWDSYLYALQLNDGSLKWRWNNGSDRMHYSPAAVWPVVSNNRVYVTAPDRYETAINLTDGTTAWRTNKHQVRETIGLSNDGKTLYSRTLNDTVFAYDITASEPTERWATSAKYGYDHNSSMLIENNGVVAFGTKNGEIVAIDGASGTIRWKHKIGNVIINTLTPIGKTDWLVTTTDGLVVRLSEK